MILFAPAYDAATSANAAVLRQLARDGDTVLLDDEATRSHLHHALRSGDAPLFAMSHGRPSVVRAQGGGPALETGDAGTFAARSIYVFACHTAAEIGAEFAQAKSVWWGYTGAITAPPDSAGTRPHIVALFDLIRSRFPVARTCSERQSFLLELKEHCDRIQEILDHDPPVDVMDSFLFLLHLWSRLRIWAGDGTPEAHPEAPPPLFLME